MPKEKKQKNNLWNKFTQLFLGDEDFETTTLTISASDSSGQVQFPTHGFNYNYIPISTLGPPPGTGFMGTLTFQPSGTYNIGTGWNAFETDPIQCEICKKQFDHDESFVSLKLKERSGKSGFHLECLLKDFNKFKSHVMRKHLEEDPGKIPNPFG